MARRMAPAIAFIATIVAANWLTTRYGFVRVGFGLTATAGTYAAGVMLVARNATQDVLGRSRMLVVILVGAVVSYAVSAPSIAVASAAAVAVGETLDMVVYSPLRRRARFGDRWWSVAVVAGDVTGAVLDTVVFIGIAFGAGAITGALPGQLVGKAWATATYLAFGWLVRQHRKVVVA